MRHLRPAAFTGRSHHDGGVTGTERDDVARVLSFDGDRMYSSNVAARIQQFLASHAWRNALPPGPLNHVAKVNVSGEDKYGAWRSFELVFHLRGEASGSGEVRLTRELATQTGGSHEGAEYLQADGTFGDPLVGGYLTNEGMLTVTRYSGAHLSRVTFPEPVPFVQASTP